MNQKRFPLPWFLFSIFLIVLALAYFLVGFQYVADITRERDGDGIEYLFSLAAVFMISIGLLSFTTLGIQQLMRKR